MLSDCTSAHTTNTSSIVAILLNAWCCCSTLHTCYDIVHSIQLLWSPCADDFSDIPVLHLLPGTIHSNCLLAGIKAMHIVFPNTSPTMPQAYPTTHVFISLSIGDSPMVLLIWLPLCYVTIDVASFIDTSQDINRVWYSFNTQASLIFHKCLKCHCWA
jgi:hypothetical protein